MLDRERVLAKIDELDGYLRELEAITPATRAEYDEIEKKGATGNRQLLLGFAQTQHSSF